MRHQVEENISERNSSVKNLVCMEKGGGEGGKEKGKKDCDTCHHKREKDG